jgi:hypothetical protein
MLIDKYRRASNRAQVALLSHCYGVKCLNLLTKLAPKEFSN